MQITHMVSSLHTIISILALSLLYHYTCVFVRAYLYVLLMRFEVILYQLVAQHVHDALCMTLLTCYWLQVHSQDYQGAIILNDNSTYVTVMILKVQGKHMLYAYS
jgi:hypothetical protein